MGNKEELVAYLKKVKTRRNYPHGKKSKSIISRSCVLCGSTNIEEVRQFSNKRNK